MILADKIMTLRKKNGWSQEELAEKLNVTRQSVSKWEGAQSVPDLEKILQMSQIFGVTTDYLIKDDLEVEEYSKEPDNESTVRRVTMEQANEFLTIKEKTAKPIALATFLCIISPISLILLSVACEFGKLSLSEDEAAGIGMCILFVLVAIASGIFIACGMKTGEYEFLEKEVIDTEYGVIGMVKERKKRYKDTYTKYNIIGTVLCICAVMPLFGGIVISQEDFFMACMIGLLLILVGIGTVFFIIAGINQASMEKLLQEGDYSVEKKKRGASITSVVTTVYWLLVSAGFIGYSFITEDWGHSWIVWPVAGVIYGAIAAICSAVSKKEK